MDWLIENAALVSNLASLAMLAVWTFYAVLFYREFQRQRTPFFVIHQAQGHGLDSTALVVNLSKEPVHVLCVMLILHTTQGTFAQRIRNFRRVSRDSDMARDVQTAIKQGPLTSGAFLGLGSFEAMLDATTEDVLRRSGRWGAAGEELDLHDLLDELQQVEIRVIALHGAHERPVGASRRFLIHVEAEDQVAIEPAVLLTRQMSSRSDRRIVRQWLQDCLPRLVSDER
ncbi:MAG: hypothetical protein WD737_12185 [Gemmatimonadota bacterium]